VTPPTGIHPSTFAAEIKTVLVHSITERLEGGGSTGRFPMSAYAGSYVLSPEQLRRWHTDGFLPLHGLLPPPTVASLSPMADALAALPSGSGVAEPSMVHHERAADGATRICRVENFCHHQDAWGALSFGIIQDVVSQAFGEAAVLFKDKLNFKGPGGGGFLAHQDATAYAPDELASRHISVSIAVDPSTQCNGPLEVSPGRHAEGILPHTDGVINADVEGAMWFEPVLIAPGDMVLFDSYLPHRSARNESTTWRRSVYLTYNPASQGDLHDAYYAKKRQRMHEGTAGAISINKDFGGEVVA